MNTVRKITVYQILALVIAAQGAILGFVHGFGNARADEEAGFVLMGLGIFAFVGHTYLVNVIISIPAGVYAYLSWIDGLLVAVLAAAGMIVQYTTLVDPGLVAWVALTLQGAGLVTSLFAQLFAAQTAKAVAAKAAAGTPILVKP
jgi:hypothetical protein